jgi:membrane associated rhomboid family serine protease
MHVPPVAVVAATTLAAVLLAVAIPRLRRLRWVGAGAVVGLLAGFAAATAIGSLGPWRAVANAAVVLLVATGAAVFTRGDGREALRAVRSRLLFGVPWGTLVVVAVVLAFYLFVQFGRDGRLLVVPFVSWSYFYPLGVLASPLAHAGLGHVTGNLIGTLALAPLAEYAFSHYPTERGTSSFESWRSNPYVRAFVLFPVGVLLVAQLTGVFSWGATIGFSGVVFAFAGFALVKYPLATVVAVTGRDVISVLWRTLGDPVTFASASPSFGPPWWAGIAVQGHLFGFLAGAVLSAALLARRNERPNAARVWIGSVVLATSMSLWAVWWYGQSAEYVLFRAGGLLLVVVLAVVLAAVAGADDRTTLLGDLTGRQAASLTLLLPVVTMCVVAVPVNLTTVSDAGLPGDPVSVDGYEVAYVENVTNERVAAVNVPYFEQATNVTASGVVVANPDRGIWTEQVSAGELAFYGDTAVTVGGVGWRESVGVSRQGWNVAGASAVYNVYLDPPDGDWRHAFASGSATADPVVAGRQVRLDADGGAFGVSVVRNDTVLETVGIPGENETATAGGLTFERNGSRLLASHENTTVTVASEESYE